MEFMNLSLYSSNWNISHLFCVGIQCIIKFAFFRGIDMYNRFHETVAFLLKLVCSLLPFVYLTSGHFELCNQYYDRQAINLRYASYSGVARIPEEGEHKNFSRWKNLDKQKTCQTGFQFLSFILILPSPKLLGSFALIPLTP